MTKCIQKCVKSCGIINSILCVMKHSITSYFLQQFHMMGQPVPFNILVAALLINTFSYCSSENVYCVIPTATSCSSCPHNSTNCSTLSEYAQEAELYFTSNTTMVFLPGDHVLDRNITVANVARLTISGESSSDNIATVVRNGSVGFSFTNMVDFKIYSLAFTSCTRSWSYGSHPVSKSRSALLLQSSLYAKLVSCSFQDNLGTALTVYNTSINLAENNEFVHNQCGCESFSERCKLGCGITALNSTLTFTGNTSFLKNRHNNVGVSEVGAGAILAVASSLHFTGTSNFFDNVKSANKKHKHAQGGGATYVTNNSVLNFHGTNNFINNSANNKGGAIYTSHNTVVTFSGTSNFISNYVHRGSELGAGGAIYTHGNAVLTFNGNNNFINNSASFGGGVYAGSNTLLAFIGTNVFSSNSADCTGGAIYIKVNVVLTLNGTNNFINNSAVNYGGAIDTYDNTGNVLTFTGANSFIGNSVQQNGGGAISTTNAVLTFSGTNSFINNSANGRFSSGGAINISPFGNAVLIFNGTNNFAGNSANYRGGVISADFNTLVTFIGTTGFSTNSANSDGGAIYVETKVLLKFIGIGDFITNTAYNGGAISIHDCVVITFTGTINFISNLAMKGGAISANRNSKLTFDGNISFTNNGHDNMNADNGVSHGGAIYLALNSTLSILPNATVRWENNHATLGGAIYVSDVNSLIYCTPIAPFIVVYVPREECFFQLPGQSLYKGIDVNLFFKNNSADNAGSVLYGGTIDNCEIYVIGLNLYFTSGDVFDMLFQYEADTDYSTTSKISSDPLYICVCKNNLPDCRGSHYYNIPYAVYPGETFQLSVPTVTVGQRDGTVFSTVRSTAISNSIDSHSVNLLDYQYLQHTNNTCTKLNYTVFSLSREVVLVLHPEGSPCSKYDHGSLYFSVKLNQTCPPGFNISESSRSCICEQRLAQYTNQCNITNGIGQITRESNQHFWVGYDNSSHELILHPYCPFDYCVNDARVFPLNNTDIQCEYNRSGLLCGHCKEGYSLILGTHQCRKCTNFYLVLLIPFAVMGVALIFLLLVCKLTVATGTLSGLVFYANIVGVNRTVFLPVKATDALSVFIAWLNLDFGIETCFYNELDAYSKIWLQFVFPAYLWLLVGLMILFSSFSHRFANLLGSNPVSVLATLILLSYTKILRTLIATVYFTHLEYPAYNRIVWLHDANVDYIVGKHIPLFLVAMLVFLFLFLPYTLLLVFGQWLQAISHLKLFSWVNSARLKPFMDSYHAPYKAKHRYWPGLLLVLRFVLLLVFAFNHQQDMSINLLTILVGTGILQIWTLVSGGVYKNWCLDALEGSFVLNLIILVGATYHVNHSGGNQLAVGYTSVSIALVTFIVILAYHIFQQMRQTKLWKKVPKLDLKIKNLKTNQKLHYLNNPINDPTESANLDQLREPWLEELLQPTHSSY